MKKSIVARGMNPLSAVLSQIALTIPELYRPSEDQWAVEGVLSSAINKWFEGVWDTHDYTLLADRVTKLEHPTLQLNHSLGVAHLERRVARLEEEVQRMKTVLLCDDSSPGSSYRRVRKGDK